MTARCSAFDLFWSRLALIALIALGPHATSGASEILRLATTTSTDNSGLIEVLVPVFEQSADAKVRTVAVGTGRALQHAVNGDVDVVLVHAKEAELKLVRQGFAVNRREIMYNEFVIVGPRDDPAGIGGMSSLAQAFRKIRESQSIFVSRGDDSGTHKKELQIWGESGVFPQVGWYREVGQGMGRTLQIADELGAYALTDKATWLFMREQLSLPVHVEGSVDGRNVYGVMAVNSAVHEHVNAALAKKFIAWISSEQAKKMIAAYKVNGEQLFYPLN